MICVLNKYYIVSLVICTKNLFTKEADYRMNNFTLNIFKHSIQHVETRVKVRIF